MNGNSYYYFWGRGTMFIILPPSIHWGQAQKFSEAEANLTKENFKRLEILYLPA